MNNRGRLSLGKYIDLSDVKLGDIDIEDIEVSLNHIYRFNGHHKDRKPLTVAQHTLLCMILSDYLFDDDKVKFGCLLHDFGEAYYGDLTSPVKNLLGREGVKMATRDIDNLIYKKFWPYPDEDKPSPAIYDAVKACDLMSLDIERRIMWSSQWGKDKWPEVPKSKMSLLDKQQLFDEVAGVEYVKLGDYLK